jgi:hypothetical protein
MFLEATDHCQVLRVEQKVLSRMGAELKDGVADVHSTACVQMLGLKQHAEAPFVHAAGLQSCSTGILRQLSVTRQLLTLQAIFRLETMSDRACQICCIC